MSDYTILSNVDIASYPECTYDRVLVDVHAVPYLHLLILVLLLLRRLRVSRPDYHILLYDNILSHLHLRQISSEYSSWQYYGFPFDQYVLKALDQRLLAYPVLLTRLQVLLLVEGDELRFHYYYYIL